MKKQLTDYDKKKCQILDKYYIVDEENRSVTVPVHYQKVSDLIDTRLGKDHKPVIKREILDDFDSFTLNTPSHFKTKLDVTIDDFEDYEPKQIIEGLEDFFEVTFYTMRKITSKQWMKGMMFLIIGVILLVALNIYQITVKVESAVNYVFDYCLDTIACVFVWESLSSICMYPSEISVTYKRIMSTLDGGSLKDSKGNVLAVFDRQVVRKTWVEAGYDKRASKTLLLVSATLLISFGLVLFNDLMSFIKGGTDFGDPLFKTAFILDVFNALFAVFTGICAVQKYNDKKPLSKLCTPFMILTFCTCAAFLGVIFPYTRKLEEFNYSYLVSIIGILSAIIIYIISMILKFKKSKKDL